MGVDTSIQRILSALLDGARTVLLRRDAMCLAVGSRQENHYHSSIKTREWMFELPHSSPLDIYRFVSWRYSGFSERRVRKFLFWQQLFQALYSIRYTQPDCHILGLTEACFSGGAIKFVKVRDNSGSETVIIYIYVYMYAIVAPITATH
jgi:hypothetical protein